MTTITERLTLEHRVFENVFDQIDRELPTLTTVGEVRLLAGLIEALLRQHGATEEDLAYAALDHVLRERGQLDRLHQDHREIDGALEKAQKSEQVGHARRHLKMVLTRARQHFRCEEETIFPLMERVLQPETLCELAQASSPERRAQEREAAACG